MVISISPSGRDSKLNNLATLTIQHKKGKFDTPNRIVTKNDFNAKDEIGADIPLTRTSNSFIIQENVDPETLQNILTKNGFLQQMISKTYPWTQKLGNANALILLYPHLTKDALKLLDDREKIKKFARFFSNLSISLNLESIILPLLGEIADLTSSIDLKQLQIIPQIDLQDETEIFTKKFNDCLALGETDSPFMAFKFAPYPKANLAYDLVMDKFEEIHEKSKGVLMLDAERYLKSATQPNVSGPHYGSLIIGDLIAERYKAGGGGKPSNSVRLFCKSNLITIPNNSQEINEKFDVRNEKAVFPNDVRLQELLQRIVENNTTPDDWKYNRPSYLSRVHENARTRPEYDNLHKSINSETSLDYLEEKKDMNKVIRDHLKKRFEK